MRVARRAGSQVATIAAATMVQVTACAKPELATTQPAGQETHVKVYVYNKEGQVVGPVESARVVKRPGMGPLRSPRAG